MIQRWEIEAVALAAVMVAWLLWLGFHDASIKTEARAGALAPVIAAQAAASAAAAARAASTAIEQSEALHEHQAQDAARAVDARDLDAFNRSVQLDATRRIATLAAAASAAAASQADMVPAADLLRSERMRARAVDAAASAARYADCLSGVALNCQKDYEAIQ